MEAIKYIYLAVILPPFVGFYFAMAMEIDTATFEENTQLTSEWWIER